MQTPGAWSPLGVPRQHHLRCVPAQPRQRTDSARAHRLKHNEIPHVVPAHAVSTDQSSAVLESLLSEHPPIATTGSRKSGGWQKCVFHLLRPDNPRGRGDSALHRSRTMLVYGNWRRPRKLGPKCLHSECAHFLNKRGCNRCPDQFLQKPPRGECASPETG